MPVSCVHGLCVRMHAFVYSYTFLWKLWVHLFVQILVFYINEHTIPVVWNSKAYGGGYIAPVRLLFLSKSKFLISGIYDSVYLYTGNDGLLQAQMTTVIKIHLLEVLLPSVQSTAHKTPRHNHSSTRARCPTYWATENVHTPHLLTPCHLIQKNLDWALQVIAK